MKKLFLFLPIVFLSLSVLAQNAREATVKFMKDNQPAAVAEYNLPEDIVTQALLQKLEKAGLSKKSNEKGFKAYKGVSWPEISSDKLDVYFKVEEKNKVSTIYMLVSKGYDNFISNANDNATMSKVFAFLNSFVNDANAYLLQQNIAAQADVVKKAQSNLDDVQKDGKKLLDEREKIEKKIAENKTEQDKKKDVVDTETKKLESLKAQVSTN